MENSLRNHALVQQQNQQQLWNREEYYRNNGRDRSSSTSAAPVSSSHPGISNSNMNSSNRSRTSGSSISGKGSSKTGSSRSAKSGEASDEAVQGVEESSWQHRYHDELQQQQLQQHHFQQQQHYHQHHHQHQRYPQHHQFYNNNNTIGIHSQQQQDRFRYLANQDNLSRSNSQQSSSYPHQYTHRQQHHYGGHIAGSATEAAADSQSHYSNILSSVSGSVTSNLAAEESYRRIGLQLSWTARGGEGEATRPPMHRAQIAPPRLSFESPYSDFRPFEEVSSNGNNSTSNGSSQENIVRKMTVDATNLFRLWQSEHLRINHHHHRRRRNSGSAGRSLSRTNKTERANVPDDFSSHRRAFAQMSLGDGSHLHSHSHSRSHNNMLSTSSKKQPGSLTAVIESASQNSSTSTNPRGSTASRANGSVRSEDKSRTSSSIATRSSIGTRTSFRSFGTLPPRGSCLTHPSEGVSNDNLCDNIEGNLIVYENDNISVPEKQVCVLTRGKRPRGAPTSDFRVQSLLGQGTFAQVFRCLHVQTGQLVAVKIVKNKPAYTRQAAVEIDVIRALTITANGTTNEKKTKSKNDNGRNKASNNGEGPAHKSNSDYMIDMVCYFLYKDHLCLVFELLGLNLYEVLKKRQFRGLPLDVTQTLVRQAVLGIKVLAQRSIVHCDLKPENILLVDEDDSESVMSAGESTRFHSSSSVNKNDAPSSSRDKKIRTDAQEPPTEKIDPCSNSDLTKANASKCDDLSNGSRTHSSDKSKNTNETDGTNKNSKELEEKTHLSDNSKSTTETNNTRKGKEQHQQEQQSIATTARSKSSIKGRSNVGPLCKSHTESTIATYETNEIQPNPQCNHRIKLIDFGSACFEGQMSHTYIQSRFYRSPEVLLGLAYDSAIDMWSLGCVAAELFLGLPILPGVHEHDQLGRILEMIGDIPDWMLDQGTKSSKYFGKFVPVVAQARTAPIQSSTTTAPEGASGSAASGRSGTEAPLPLPQWRIKTQHEYIASLSQSDMKKKGGLAKLQKQPGNRYFKKKLLSDIILHKGQSGKQEDLSLLKSFIHFLYGILDPDPWTRWTAFQVASHPFCTGATMQENVDSSKIKDGNHANRLFNLYWEAPTDPTIYRRKLLNVQKTREKQQAARRGLNRSHNHNRSRSVSPSSQDGLPTVRNAFSKNNNQEDETQSRTNHTVEDINQSGGRLVHQGSYQGSFNTSSSTIQHGSNQGVRLLGYDSGTLLGFSGPQSFSEAGGSVGVPGSFNEGDFALALHRPGVVPMGDSVTTATTSTTSMSSGNNSRSCNNQTTQVGSYGMHLVPNNGNQELRFTTGNIPRTSRSFGEGDVVPAVSAAIPKVIGSAHQQVVYSSSHENRVDIGPPVEVKAPVKIGVDPTLELKSENVTKEPTSATDINVAGQTPPEKTQPLSEENSAGPTNSNAARDHAQSGQNLGIYENPHLYQQQLAAMQQQFQQQQLLLQQQQAAIALQQEQLRYFSNMSNATGMKVQQFGIPGAPAPPATAMTSQQFGIPGTPTTPVPNLSTTAGIGAQPYGMAGASTAPAASINAQQFGITSATPAASSSSTINAQQFSLPSSAQAASVQANGIHPAQYGLGGAAAPIQGCGYFVVTNGDGTQMIVPSNQAIQIPGQIPGITPAMHGIFPGQLPGLSPGSTQMQATTQAGLPSVTVPPGTAVPGMPGMQEIHAGGIIPPTGGVPGVSLAGMPPIPNINSNASPVVSGGYANSDQQQHLQH